MEAIITFSKLNAEERPSAGGKANTLARLYQAGYPVPEGFVVLPHAFAGDELGAYAWEQIQERLLRLRQNSNGVEFAVRSSALSEDSAQASFAGEFETVLGARHDDEIRQAIQNVRRSRLSERVQTYSQAQGIDASHEIAVVVQQMVQAEMSGILFTADPVTGDRGTLNGNYVRGLGERLVSGEVTGETFTLQRLSGNYQGPAELKPYARKLYELAVSLEQELGCPQDIEWAVAKGELYLLQSRPITTLHGHNPMKGEWNDSLLGDFLWSNVNVGEAYMHVMTPFTWSMVHRAFSEMSLLPGYDLIGNIGGRPYFNVSITASVMRALGRNVQDMVNEFAGGYNNLPNGMDLPEIPLPRGAFFPLMKRGIYMQWKQWTALLRKDRFLAENPGWCQRMRARIRETRSGVELLDLWYGEIADYGIHNFWLLGATAYEYGELAGRLRRDLIALVGREEADVLLSSVSSDTELLASLGPVVGLWRLFRGEMTREAFLTQYGHRGPDEGEYLIPRPAEDPQWLDRQLEAFARSPVDVDAMLAKQRAKFDTAWARFQQSYPRKVRSVKRRLEKAAAAARLREAVRSEMMRMIWVSRDGALRAGELTGLGEDVFFLNIDELEQVLRGHSTPANGFIPARKQTYEQYKSLPPYPPVILGRFDPYEWADDPNRRNDVFDARTALPVASERETGSGTLFGSPGSAGCAEGIVRRIDSPDEGDELQSDEVLVTTHTNIGWTLLFPRAAAIVTDVGAPLSHAAIVARELGIPAVVGCGDATMRLKTGDRVRVDGSQGTVELLDYHEPAREET
jgi:phosphohistidine swiveling domain-containing protein